MNVTVLQFLKSLFQWAWRLMTCFYLPGTTLTPAALFVCSAFVITSIRFIRSVFHISVKGDDKDV